MEEKKSTENTSVSSNLFALECLATTAGQLHETEKLREVSSENSLPQTTQSRSVFENDELSNKVAVVQMAPMSSAAGSREAPVPPISFGGFYSPFTQPPVTSIRPFTDFTFPPPFSHTPFRNFMDLPMPPTSFGLKMEDMPWNRTGLPPIMSSHETSDKNISSDTAKSAFDIVPKRHNGIASPPISFDMTHGTYKSPEVSMGNANNIPQQPPMLFRIDQPNNSSLLETLVQESQKILSNQEEQSNQSTSSNENSYPGLKSDSRKESDQASKTNVNADFKRAREMVLISPQKKSVRKQRNGLHSVNDVKRAYGGPPFKPGHPPPAMNTRESAMCCLYEHTLLKMATRGFWSGDRGPLQDVFRLSRVENSDLQYDMKAITKHCYNVVKRKLENAEDDKKMMHKHMRNYVDEFDSYLERIYPVSSIAINLYLPTAADYNLATWHGIVPTGWSEYRRAVIIREVFEVLYHFSSTGSGTLPEYNSKFFNKPEPDKTLKPIPLDIPKKKTVTEPNTEESGENENKDQNNNGGEENIEHYNGNEVKFSRAFEALWTRSAPHEPYFIMKDTAEMKLREYLENFPIEVYSPSDDAIIVVDEKKYKSRNILGFFRRGVQLVDYSKDSGNMVIDTISTIRNVSATSAVRKIPPGRISKLVHPDLHLENYTNAIHQVGKNGVDADGVHTLTVRPPKIRRRRGKNRNSGDTEEKKVKKRRTKSHVDHNTEQSSVPNNEQFLAQQTPVVEKLDSIESICNSMKMEGIDEKVFMTPPSQHFPSFPHPSSIDSFKTPDDMIPPRMSHGDMQHRIESMLPKESLEETKTMDKMDRTDFVHQCTQTCEKAETITPNLFSPDILSPMCMQQQQQQKTSQPPMGFEPFPSGPPDQQRFSLHLMIDSYRRAAKYLLDTANHLELVARHGNHGNMNNGTATESDVSKKEKAEE